MNNKQIKNKSQPKITFQMGQQLTKQITNRLLDQKGEKTEKIVNQLLSIAQESLGQGKVQEIGKKAAEILLLSDTQKPSNTQQLFRSFSTTNPSQPVPVSIIQNQIGSIAKTQSLICQTIVEIMSTRKLYHIRQKFRRLSLQVLGLQNAQFYVFHDSGRVQYHDFRENYITQLLEQDQKRKVIQHVLANAAGMVEDVEFTNSNAKSTKEIKNVKTEGQQKKSSSTKKVTFFQQSTLFMKLFNISTSPYHQYSGQINKQSEKYSILSLFTYFSKQPLSFQKQINPKIVQKLIKISMIQIEQESEYDIIKFYCKQLLDVLGLIVADSEAKLKFLLKEERITKAAQNNEQETKIELDEKVTLVQTIKKLFSKQPELIQKLLPLSSKYQQFRYQLLQRQRMYSKYVCEDNVLFMDFDEQGELFFLSNNRKNSEYQTLLYNLQTTNELCIQKIFQENLALQQHIRKSLDDEVKNKKLYDLQDGLKARVIRNQVNEIQRIMVLIQDPPVILSHGSFSSSTLQGISSSNNNQKKRKADSTGSDTVSLGKGSKGSANLIKTLQKQNPGITENGWLNLFIKDHQLRRNSSNVMTKKKQTLFAKGEQGPNSTKTISAPLNFQEIQFLQEQDIYSPDTNLLLFEDQYLEPFVKKVFTSMKYFSSLQYNKQHFDNFLFHLHQGYQLHENTFHNFTHGVNVMHTCFLISNIQENLSILSPLKVFSTVLSGLCHDVGHTGRTNSFQIASRSKKALTYNDLSPLENFHVSYAFQILRRPENNFLQSLSLEQYNEIRKDMISNILYTDIKEHFPLIKKFKAIDYKPEEKPLSGEDLRTLTGMIIHTSDFGGSAKEFEICQEWSRRVNLEFIAQYKQEQQLGIAQTPFFKDLEVESIMAKNQMGFLKVIVFPLYEGLDDFYKDKGTLHKLRVYAEVNIKEWQNVHINSSAIKNEQKDEVKEEQKKQN